MSEEALRQLGLETEDLDILDLYRRDQAAAIRRWGAKWESWWNAARPKEGQPWMAEYDDASWKNGTARTWRRGRCGPAPTLTASSARCGCGRRSRSRRSRRRSPAPSLDLGSVNQEDETWVNGSVPRRLVFCQSHAVCDRARRAEGRRQRHRHQHLLRLARLRPPRARGEPRHPLRRQHQRAALESVEVPGSAGRLDRPPAALGLGPRHDAALQRDDRARSAPTRFRGAVWYQGESDVHFAGSYYKATLLGDDGGVAAAVRGS